MTDEFTRALLYNAEKRIPEEYDWFAPLIGDWDFNYYDSFEQGFPRHVEGEWLFRRILEGTGVEDLFICPSREARKTDMQPDAEYGTAIRMYNAERKCYDMVYACAAYMIRVTFLKEGENLVGTVHEVPGKKYVFYDITKDSFKWKNITVSDDGTENLISSITARRKPETNNA